MAKGIIVVEVPEYCRVCDFYYPAREGHTGKFLGACRLVGTVRIENSQKTPDWCPILPTPEKMDVESAYNLTDLGFVSGWNACIEKILGENNS